MRDSTYASLAAVCIGVANLFMWAGYDCQVFIVESVMHSIHARRPEDAGAHDGYYGMAVLTLAFMFGNFFAPSLSHILRPKWICSICTCCFIFYFLCFQFLHRVVFFSACIILGSALAMWNVGYNGYLLQISTRQTLEHTQALSWLATSFSILSAGVLYWVVTAMGEASGITTDTGYRDYSDTEIRWFFAAYAGCAIVGLVIFLLLPNRDVANSINSNRNKDVTLKESFGLIFSTLTHKRTLLLFPFYIYTGMYLSFWLNVFPTTIQFTKALSHHIYLPAYFGIVFTLGSVIMSGVTIFLSKRMTNFGLRPCMTINAVTHVLTFALIVVSVPGWSTVEPNDGASLLIQPNVATNLIIAFLFGIGDAANNTARTVMTSLIIPESKTQSVSVSRIFHACAGSTMLFLASGITVYTYMTVLSVVLIAAYISFWVASGLAMAEHRKESAVTPPTIEAMKAAYENMSMVKEKEGGVKHIL